MGIEQTLRDPDGIGTWSLSPRALAAATMIAASRSGFATAVTG